MKKVGVGRLQLRQGGKHLILVKGRRDKTIKFHANDLMDHEVEVYVEDLGASKKKILRVCRPRLGGLR